MKGLQCRDMWFFRRSADNSERTIIRDVNANFDVGRIALITGATGAGKSTFLHILAGILRPAQGEILADGEPVSRWTSTYRDLWRRKVGIVFQSPRFLNDLTVLENVILPMVPRGFDIDELRERGMKILDDLGIGKLAGESVFSLSGGERQRASIARALISRPRFLLADEPTAHQDNFGIEWVFRLLEEAAKSDAAVALVSHDPRVARAGIAADRWHLAGGRLEKIE